MAKPRPIVLGCDPGPNHTAFGVMGDGVILHTSMLMGVRDWDPYCVKFQDILIWLIETYHVQYLAIEDWTWFGMHALPESSVQQLIGIARTCSRTIPVRVIPMAEWSAAITGERPTHRRLYGTTSGSWKKTIRKALALRCKEMGVDLDAIVGTDEGNHQVDAIAIALFCQDFQYIISYQGEK